MMEFNELMALLESMGTAQNVKVYKRHGVREPLFGVSYANLGKLKKKIKIDTSLARELWQTKNADARTLACMIADGSEFGSEELDSWVLDVDNTGLAGYYGGLVGRSAHTAEKIDAWIQAEEEFVQDSGYSCVCQTLKGNPDKLSDEFCNQILNFIEERIHTAPNRARQAMNNALIAIGTYKRNCREEALVVAGRIGKVEIDHGDTSCKTPDAIPYIKKAVAHLEKKKAKN
ncbi:DNA alkylation repair protein [bacterium]|nr:DNA alkylation repair protein [bacterium]